jgi:hypothetical protein
LDENKPPAELLKAPPAVELSSIRNRETRDKIQETRDKRQETRDKRQETKTKDRDKKTKTKSASTESVFLGCGLRLFVGPCLLYLFLSLNS